MKRSAARSLLASLIGCFVSAAQALPDRSIVCEQLLPPHISFRDSKLEQVVAQWIDDFNGRCAKQLDGLVREAGALTYLRLRDGSEKSVLRPMFLHQYDHERGLLFYHYAQMHVDEAIAFDSVNGESVSMPSVPVYSPAERWGLSIGKNWPEFQNSFAIFDMGQHPPRKVFAHQRTADGDGRQLTITKLSWAGANRIEGSGVERDERFLNPQERLPDRPVKVSVDWDGERWSFRTEPIEAIERKRPE